ncbi:hypothetical protein [Robertmurraya sp. P23]|uniref:hypothetical protein n=1 Tax=Robertmurraya sp. P23 TaxID=3436931 RepID=UPI003D9938BA
MNTHQSEFFEKLISNQEKVTREFTDYWQTYSDFGAWQFWVILLMLILPLILLYFTIDRTKIFVVCFFGFATHVLFAYVEIFGVRSGLWGYPYQLVPYLPSISLDASIIPIGAMLVFQWTLNKNKNFYLYGTLTAAVFGFAFKPLLTSLDLFQMYKWVNIPLVFLLYVVIFFIAYLATKLFMRMQEKSV